MFGHAHRRLAFAALTDLLDQKRAHALGGYAGERERRLCLRAVFQKKTQKQVLGADHAVAALHALCSALAACGEK